MKPIFKEEKEFLERKLNVEIPVNSWRNGSKRVCKFHGEK